MVLAVEEKNHLQQTLDRVPSPNFNLALRNLLLREIAGDVLSEIPLLQELALRVSEKVRIFTIRKTESFVYVAGVDAGSQVIPLASRQYAVIGALAYRLPDCIRFFLSPESIIQNYNDFKNGLASVVNIRREAKLFETAISFLERYPDTELVLIDGPLAFSNFWNNGCKEDEQRRLIDSINELLLYCRDNEIHLAGIVKRSSARYLLNYIGMLNEGDFNDVSVLNKILNPGERTDIFSPQAALRMAVKNSYIMDLIHYPIYSFYARLSNEWNIPPIRIDLPAYSLGYLEEIAGYCYSTSIWQGIPLPIIRADEEVKVSRKFIADVYSEILARVGRESGDISQLVPYWGEGGWMGV